MEAGFLASDRTYGVWRVWRDPLADGAECGLQRIERLMDPHPHRGRPGSLRR